ncbi:TPA: tail virion protein G7P-2 [Providencia stuartii]
MNITDISTLTELIFRVGIVLCFGLGFIAGGQR